MLLVATENITHTHSHVRTRTHAGAMGRSQWAAGRWRKRHHPVLGHRTLRSVRVLCTRCACARVIRSGHSLWARRSGRVL